MVLIRDQTKSRTPDDPSIPGFCVCGDLGTLQFFVGFKVGNENTGFFGSLVRMSKTYVHKID